jgi:hemerythrin-like domain-containing protein
MTTIDLLEQLRIDHDNARRLLDLLAAELANVRREEPADFTLMRDIMQYLTHYPDLVHHPAEEELVQRLCEVSTERAGLQRRLVRQRIGADHRNLSEKGRAFFDTVSRVVDGGLTARADLVGTGTAYIEAQRAHMDWEEHHLFPPRASSALERSARFSRRSAPTPTPSSGPSCRRSTRTCGSTFSIRRCSPR